MISDAAVEAAHNSIIGGSEESGPDFAFDTLTRKQVQAILEAAAPYMLAQRAVESVLALHREMECRDEDNEPVGGSYCEECKDLDDHSGERVHEVYPCMTVREITKALAGEETFTVMRDRIEAMNNPYRSQA